MAVPKWHSARPLLVPKWHSVVVTNRLILCQNGIVRIRWYVAFYFAALCQNGTHILYIAMYCQKTKAVLTSGNKTGSRFLYEYFFRFL